MNVEVKIKVIKDVGWSIMYLNFTTSKGAKIFLMMIPHKTLWGTSTKNGYDCSTQNSYRA
jgi:hypothetical protein